MMDEKKVDPKKARALKVWELEQQGFNQRQIAKELGVSEKTISRDRRGPTYLERYEANRTAYLEDLSELRKSDQHTIRLEAVKEMGRFDRSGTKILADAALRQTKGEILTPEQKAKKITAERERKAHFWFEVVKIQPWQHERVRLHFMGKPYDHISPTWKLPKSLSTV